MLPSSRPLTTRLGYPPTAQSDVTDTLHGVAVPDPYRWLEDDNSPETQAWVAAQNKVTFHYLDQIPARGPLRERLTRLWNFERYGIPFRQGGRYFFTKNDGLQNQSVLHVTDALDAPPRTLLDPNTLSADGTVALSGYSVSDDGNLLAYGLSASGSDWNEWKVRDVRTGTDLSDHLKWVKFSRASWTKDGKGFFYSRYDAPAAGDTLKGVNKFQKLYYHRLGTPQSEDVLTYERRDQQDWGFGGHVTDDGHYLIITIWQGTDRRNRVYYRDLTRPEAPVVKLFDTFDADYTFIDNIGPRFWFFTDLRAPRGRVVTVDTTQPGAPLQEVIPKAAETLKGVNLLGDEVLTPDSSRYWPADQYAPNQSPPSYDKQFVRDHDRTVRHSGCRRSAQQVHQHPLGHVGEIGRPLSHPAVRRLPQSSCRPRSPSAISRFPTVISS